MCGIFGQSIGEGFYRGAARECLHTMNHRGPDQWGDWQDDDLYLGHRRLSILDLSSKGRQPMKSEDLILCANGEIWNYKLLRAELEKAGHNFQSHSDSEILLHGYRQWGLEDLLNRCEGMFAFALYDAREKALYLARDRYGVKPLYFSQTEKGFAFASEIKALFAWDDELRYFSRRGLRDWLKTRGSRSGLTPYADVRCLPPGHGLRYCTRTGAIDIARYYALENQITGTNSDPAELEERLQIATGKRLMGDVPVGAQLSGGVDSSLIASMMRSAQPGKDIHAFSVGFKRDEDQHLSEEAYAQRVSKDLNLTHHQLNIGPDDIAENFEHSIWLHDGLLDFPNSIPIYLLSKFAKNHVTAQLTGEGADEIFAGYSKFKHMQALQSGMGQGLRFMPFMVAQRLGTKYARAVYLAAHYGADENAILENLNSYISAPTLDKILGPSEELPFTSVLISALPKEIPFLKKLMIMDHQTYLQAVLERQDKASMGAGLESRVPFLDQGLVHWALNLPQEALIHKGQTKAILKNLAAQKFDKDFARRKKRGFPLPLANWLADPQGLKNYWDKTAENDFLLAEEMRNYKRAEFDHVLLHYADPESLWVHYFMTVLRAAQDVFKIRGVKP